MRILGIETSCDETGVAVYDSEKGLLAHDIYSQIPLHAEHGGVVPELASRDHVRKILPLVKKVLNESFLSTYPHPNPPPFRGRESYKECYIDGIAYTAGPGLIGALLVGATVARTLAYAWNLPAIPVHHLESHLLAPLLENDPPTFPFLTLLVSGGHTMLIHAKALGKYEILGESLDDAAGEAFDKIAKLLGLGYPGGPQLAKLAERGDKNRFDFPRPMTNRPGLDFSFSGLKTSVLTTLNQFTTYQPDKKQGLCADIAASFQEAVIETLAIKCERALKQTHLKNLVVAGGVGANLALRERLKKLEAKIYFPRQAFCTDNGAMVALTGCLKFQSAQKNLTIHAKARWDIEEMELH